MKNKLGWVAVFGIWGLSVFLAEATDRFVSLSGGHVSPFTSWPDAATNIQEAIDASAAGDIIWVTNGIYSTGGKAMVGDLTNRVALTKALKVQSVNGPAMTTIRGVWDSTTNGPLAVRCAWLTNAATLSGFTLSNGATRPVNSFPSHQMNGGGVWGASTNAIVTNCIIAGNAASSFGGGAYQVTLKNCELIRNNAVGDGGRGTVRGEGGGSHSSILLNCVLAENVATASGGGANNSQLKNCAIINNSAILYGGGAYGGNLLNCTVVSNYGGGYNVYGAAVAFAALTNCIVYGNPIVPPSLYSNYYNCTFSFSCSSPLPAGNGNISSDPLFLPDGFHLSESSPCRAGGTNGNIGSDMDGQIWLNPPSIGADEWHPQPLAFQQPELDFQSSPTRRLNFGGFVAGKEPFVFHWLKDGAPLTEGSNSISNDTMNLIVTNFGPADAGNYQLVASNGFGVSTSAVVEVVIHCVDVAATSPVPPFSDWASAAATIQNAIDIAQEGDIVLVTNGIYSTGGKVMAGDLTNRVALTKPLIVVGVNGPAFSVIQGEWDASTNGPLAVRCAWVTNGAVLSGFTLQGGATRTNGGNAVMSGGGVWGVSTNAVVENCFIFTNAAASWGGGTYQTTLNRCKIVGNRSFSHGGGVALGILKNTLVAKNFATGNGGGVYAAGVVNCTIVDNNGSFTGGLFATGTSAPPKNSIIYGNNWLNPSGASEYFDSGLSGNPTYCCIFRSTGTPFAGVGNINASPQIIDDVHLAVTSPCRGAGSPLYASGADIDGEPWLSPPSIGCDEVIEAAINGPLAVSAASQWSEIPERQNMALIGTIYGRATRAEWSFGDGSGSAQFSVHAWTNAGDYTATFTAYNYDHTNGVSANTTVHVVPLITPTVSSTAFNGSNFVISFIGQSNVSYRLERATNLVAPIVWQTAAFPMSSSNLVQAIDSKATNAAQFYRVRIP